MNKISTDRLYVLKSKIPESGNGVFANIDIKEGDLIERCPIIELPDDNLEAVEQSFLVNYIFYFGEKRERMLLALGYGSIYNHKENPNAKYRIDEKEATIEFIAINNIKKDDEITVNYIQDHKDNKNPLWFVK